MSSSRERRPGSRHAAVRPLSRRGRRRCVGSALRPHRGREPRAGAWRRLDIAILDAQGRRVWGFDEFSRRGNEPVGFSVTLGTGTWRVQAKTDTGLTGAATIHVPDLTAEPAPVVIELR